MPCKQEWSVGWLFFLDSGFCSSIWWGAMKVRWKYFWKHFFLFNKVMFYITLYIVNFLWIVSSTSQSLLFIPFDAVFCASVLLSFLLWGTYWHVVGCYATYFDFLANCNPVCSRVLYSSLYEETQVYLQLMFIASSACFVCKVVNDGKKEGVVLFNSGFQNTWECKKTWVLWQDSRWTGRTLK